MSGSLCTTGQEPFAPERLVLCSQAEERRDLQGPRITVDLLRGCPSADYALLSPCVRRYGNGAARRRVCDESFAR
jgi:hypothetical protein